MKEEVISDEIESYSWEDADLVGLHLIESTNSAVMRLMKGTTGWGMGWGGVLPTSNEAGGGLSAFYQDFRNLSCIAVLKLKRQYRHPLGLALEPLQGMPSACIEKGEPITMVTIFFYVSFSYIYKPFEIDRFTFWIAIA
jgi:hypothetical protein